jgi:predicted dehydrogenase
VASVKFVDGTIGKLSASLEELNAPYQFNIVLVGREGAVINNHVYSRTMFPEHIDFVTVPSNTQQFDSVIHDAFQKEIDNFADHILNGVPILSDVLDACNSIEVALAIEESAIVGKPVKIIGM